MKELRATSLPWVLFGGTVGFSHVSNSCLLRFWKSEPFVVHEYSSSTS